jgi:hypothetical protein
VTNSPAWSCAKFSAAGDFGGEAAQLIDHRIDGFLKL